MLNSKPYTYLDDAPLEERRARAVTLRRSLPENARDLGALDPDAIERVVDEARPDPRDPEELHDVFSASSPSVLQTDFRFAFPIRGREPWFDELVSTGRAAIADTDGGPMWFAAENLRLDRALYPGATIRPAVRLPAELACATSTKTTPASRSSAATWRSRARSHSPSSPSARDATRRRQDRPRPARRRRLRHARPLPAEVADEEFCDRRLLARIHRYTLDRLRQEIEPVTSQDLMRFLLRWQHVAPGTQLEGKRGLLEAVTQLQGFDIPAVAWERHILPARVAAYKGSWLDELCISGDVAWAPPRHPQGRRQRPLGRRPPPPRPSPSSAAPTSPGSRRHPQRQRGSDLPGRSNRTNDHGS